MDRHPLIFLSLMVTLGVLSGLQLALLLLLHRRLPRLARQLMSIRNNTDYLIDQEKGPDHGN